MSHVSCVQPTLVPFQELDCGRLFRLICKLDTVLERPEYVARSFGQSMGIHVLLFLPS